MRECQSGLPLRRVERDEVAAAVAGEDHPPGRRQQPAAAAAGERMPPGDLAGLRIDRRQEVAERSELRDRLAAEAHRSARIGIGQIEHVEAVVLLDVEEAGVRRVRRRRPVRHAAFDRRHERAGNRRFLRRIRIDLARRPLAERPVRRRAVLARDEVLAGDAIERVEVAVARRGRHELARLAVDRRVDQDRRLRRIPVVRVVHRRLEVPRHLAGVDVDRDQRAGEQVVALAAGAGVARASDCRCRRCRASSPDRTSPGIQTCPPP